MRGVREIEDGRPLPPNGKTNANYLRELDLLADAELLDNVFVALGIVALEVVQQTTSSAHHHEKSATGRVVLLMGLEVFGQFANPLAQNCDLDLWAAGVGRVRAVLADNALFFLAG
jgi:hypothetical protein